MQICINTLCMKTTRLKRFSGAIGTIVILEKSAVRTLFVTSLVIATIIVVERCRVVETSSNGSLQWLTDNGGPVKTALEGYTSILVAKCTSSRGGTRNSHQERVGGRTIRKRDRSRSFYRLKKTRKVGGTGLSYVAALFFQGACKPTRSHRRAFTGWHSTSRIEIPRVSIAQDEKRTLVSSETNCC